LDPRKNVAVDIEGYLYVGMTETFADNFGMNPLGIILLRVIAAALRLGLGK